MLQIDILSGKQAGTQVVARHFPFVIGRGATDDLQIAEPGVWDTHVEISLNPDSSAFEVRSRPDTSYSLNQEPTSTAVLKNGDLITLGAAQLRINISPVRQKSLLARETLIWVGLIFIFAVQIVLLTWLAY